MPAKIEIRQILVVLSFRYPTTERNMKMRWVAVKRDQKIQLLIEIEIGSLS